jgi:hypothetical protein
MMAMAKKLAKRDISKLFSLHVGYKAYNMTVTSLPL